MRILISFAIAFGVLFSVAFWVVGSLILTNQVGLMTGTIFFMTPPALVGWLCIHWMICLELDEED